MSTDPLFSSKTVGYGPQKIIAIHGWMGDHHLFDPLHPLIDEEKWTVCFPDCRGYGERRSVEGDMTVEEIAADTFALADHLGWTQFHVLGHSMAGMAAQRLMVDAPDRLLSAMLLAPVPATGARIDDARRELLLKALSDPATRLQLIDVNTGKVRDQSWLEELRDLSLSGTNPEAMARYMSSWTGQGFADVLQGNTCPATVIIGRLDPGSPEERVREVYGELLGNAQVDVLEGTGHYAMQEAPGLLLETIKGHLERSRAC